MKKFLVVLAGSFALSGCAIVPAYGPSGPYMVAPAPAIVVQPYYGYGGYGYRGYGGYGGYGRGGRHWR